MYQVGEQIQREAAQYEDQYLWPSWTGECGAQACEVSSVPNLEIVALR